MTKDAISNFDFLEYFINFLTRFRLFVFVCLGRPRGGGQPKHGHRRVPLHVGGEQGANDAGVSGTDDRVPAAALERQPEGDARAAVLAPGGGRALLEPCAGRRHALSDGARLVGARAREPGRAGPRAGPGGARAAGGAPRRSRAPLPQGEKGHPDAGARPTERRHLGSAATGPRPGPPPDLALSPSPPKSVGVPLKRLPPPQGCNPNGTLPLSYFAPFLISPLELFYV